MSKGNTARWLRYAGSRRRVTSTGAMLVLLFLVIAFAAYFNCAGGRRVTGSVTALLKARAHPTTEFKIPLKMIQSLKRLHTLPMSIVKNYVAATEMNPEWEWSVLDDDAVFDFMKTQDPLVQRAFEKAPRFAFKADIFRVAYLAQHGGLWADVDIGLSKCPILSQIRPETTFWWSGSQSIFAAAPGHPLLLAALEAIKSKPQDRSDLTTQDESSTDFWWEFSGPGMWDHLLRIAPKSQWLGRDGLIDGGVQFDDSHEEDEMANHGKCWNGKYSESVDDDTVEIGMARWQSNTAGRLMNMLPSCVHRALTYVRFDQVRLAIAEGRLFRI